MTFRMEKYDPQKHDPWKVANIIYSADPELNYYVFGDRKEAVPTIKKLLEMGDNLFSIPYLECAVYDDELVGILISSTVQDKVKIDRASGKAFIKALGFWKFIRKFPNIIRMTKMVNSNLDQDAYFLHFIAVDSPYQNQGWGSKMMEHLLKDHEKIYVDVNIHNLPAQKFYQKMGFKLQSKHTINFKNKMIGTYSMKLG